MPYNRPPMPVPDGRPPLPPRCNVGGIAPPIPARTIRSRRVDVPVQEEFRQPTAAHQIDRNCILSSGPPLSVFPSAVHEVSLPAGTANGDGPSETNKFYGNMLLGNQTNPVWTHPYSLWCAKDSSFYGLAVSHTRASQRVFGPGSPPQYFFNPVGIKSFIFSSTEFATAQDFSLGLSSLKHLSAQAYLRKNDQQFIHFPLIQGMGFVTAIYHNLGPKIQSAVGFRSFNIVQKYGDITKYEAILENEIRWSLYVQSRQAFELRMQDGNTLLGNQNVQECIIQIVADTAAEIDTAAGCYATDCELACSVDGPLGNYSLHYQLEGNSTSGKTLMYALPHHVKSFSDSMFTKEINSRLDSTVRGTMTGYITDVFDMKVSLPTSLEFQPFTTITGKDCMLNYKPEVLETIKKAAAWEVNGDVVNESNLDSMYFSGKVLAKYAWILYCCQFIIKDAGLVSTLLPKLKIAFQRFTSNSQVLPLNYDQTWRGLVSSGTSSQDFGNSYYNDHHFHYSYHVITAAIIAKVDQEAGEKDWLAQINSWVENLIRDYANPSEADSYFPAFRSFDWFNGHSFAKGLFESGDGKDEESSSEDVNASYALKLWGLVTQNRPLIELSDIQLGILRTSINSYFLYSDDNEVMPPTFIPNKVSGILFENKIDHTTYFGNELQFIQMIHAIPITSASSFIRTPKFVEEEWEQKLSAIVDKVNDGWKGIMMLNVALFNPRMAYEFFSGPAFDRAFLDNGQSLTWSLAYSGAFI